MDCGGEESGFCEDLREILIGISLKGGARDFHSHSRIRVKRND